MKRFESETKIMSWKIRSSLLPLILTMLISLGWAIPLRYTALDLGTLGGSATPLGLNDLGEVVGYFYISGNVSHAFLYSGGIMKDLGTLGGSSSQASGIKQSWTSCGPC